MSARSLLMIILSASLLLLNGCLELDLHVQINEDGSALVTEKLGYSEQLLDLASTSPKDRALLDQSLTKEGALQRMATMGKGVELVSHDVANRVISDTLFKESTTVYKIPDINDLRLGAPFPNLWGNGKIAMRFVLEPDYKRTVNGGGGTDLPGYMAIEYHFEYEGADGKAIDPEQKPPPPLSPAAAQQFRNLLPVVQEMARSATVKVTLESYNTLNDGWWSIGGAIKQKDRDLTHAVKYVELLNISGQNRDEFDHPVLGDEDTLIEFIRGDWNGSHIHHLLLSSPRPGDFRFDRDSKTPLIYTGMRLRYKTRYIFLPSIFQYKKYFEGKTFDDQFAPVPPKE